MCPTTKYLSGLLRPALLSMFLLALSHGTFAQNPDGVEIPTIDMRGHDPSTASLAAIKNSRNHVVVVLIRGGDEKLVEETKGQLKALVHEGYGRIGVVLCDTKPGEVGPVIGIVSDGTAYAAIKRAKPDTVTMWQLYHLVQDAYRDDILPYIDTGGDGKN